MRENKLLTRQLTENKIATVLSDWLTNDTFLYSYLVRATIEDDTIISYRVQVNVSQEDKYNTILKQEAILDIINRIEQNTKHFIIGYGQPPLEVMCEAFEPLVTKLSQQMATQWSIPFEDLRQMCYLCMTVLYKKGYYVHKSLLRKVFINEVLQSMRKEYRQKPEGYPGDVSLDDTIAGTDLVRIATIEDTSQSDQLREIEEADWKTQRTNKQRQMVVDRLGQRRYEDLVLKVQTGTLTSSDRQAMYRVGKRLRTKWQED